MAKITCGFSDVSGVATGSQLLAINGPTLLADIGFDQNFKQDIPGARPIAGMAGINGLVDTGAVESCIDNSLAGQLNLPIIDRRHTSGAHGKHEVNVYLAQVHIPALGMTIDGAFSGVDLIMGGQKHGVLIGRTFLQYFTMVYEGKTGIVTLSSD